LTVFCSQEKRTEKLLVESGSSDTRVMNALALASS
jgi:hypothetical protein